MHLQGLSIGDLGVAVVSVIRARGSALKGTLLLPAALALIAVKGQAEPRSQSPLPPVEASLIAPAIRVADAGRVAAFYENILDMHVLMSRDVESVHETMLAFSNSPARPAIMLLSSSRPPAPPAAGIGETRLIVGVGDMAAVLSRLQRAGIRYPTPSSPRPGMVVLHISDPENNEIELVQSETGG